MTTALSVEFGGKLGVVYFDSAEARHGPLADVGFGEAESFYVEERSGGVTARLFGLPDGAPAALARGLNFGPGLTARIVRDVPDTGHVLRGPGAPLALQLRSQPGFRSQGLPTLPAPWLAAIVSAAKGRA